MSKPKISAEVSADEMGAYRDEAKRMGMTLSEWMRRALNSSLPKPVGPQAMDVAFAKLDETSGQSGMEALLAGPNAVPAALPAKLPEVQQFQKLPVNEPIRSAHPCMYLKPQMPGVLRGGEAQGTCDQNTQRGKPCYWNAQSCAKNCSVFTLRLDLRAAQLAKPQQNRFRR